jgi:hypothetical protein
LVFILSLSHLNILIGFSHNLCFRHFTWIKRDTSQEAVVSVWVRDDG